ncbi:hypothetical protein F5Y15DRAFT_374481 [Xylariaceae sp. FL0016]|nr:hypothetical protein F5Y15DRAFT_374481 [Xylariaceae sp. FL0016]
METHAAEKRHTAADSLLSPAPTRSSERRRQARRLFLGFLTRWVITAAICAGFVGTLKGYDRKLFMIRGQTHVYNAITAGLTIALSLNLQASLGGFATAFKWVMVASRPYPPKVFDLIMGFDASAGNSVKLLFRRGSLFLRLRLVCLAWIFVNLSAQIGTALIGLTYSVEPLSGDSEDFPTPRGNGTTADFTFISYWDEFDDLGVENVELGYWNAWLDIQRTAAFQYGVGAIGSAVYSIGPGGDFYSSFHSTTFDTESKKYTNTITNRPDWAEDSLTPWNIIGRAVQSWAECWDVPISNLTAFNNATSISFEGDAGPQSFTIPQAPLEYATYISDTSNSCGPRCTWVYSIFSVNETTELFQCKSTVDKMRDWYTWEIVNTTELTMPDEQAAIIAGAIGWGDIEVEAIINEESDSLVGRFLASSFSEVSYWTPSTIPNATYLSDYFIAHFAAATIEAYDEYGTNKHFDDLKIPGVASVLDVKWRYSMLALVLIPGLQGLLAVICITVVFANRVVVHDSSPFAMAKLLGPIVTETRTGTWRKGSDIAKAVKRDLVYTRDHDGYYHVRAVSAGGWDEQDEDE